MGGGGSGGGSSGGNSGGFGGYGSTRSPGGTGYGGDLGGYGTAGEMSGGAGGAGMAGYGGGGIAGVRGSGWGGSGGSAGRQPAGGTFSYGDDGRLNYSPVSTPATRNAAALAAAKGQGVSRTAIAGYRNQQQLARLTGTIPTTTTPLGVDIATPLSYPARFTRNPAPANMMRAPDFANPNIPKFGPSVPSGYPSQPKGPPNAPYTPGNRERNVPGIISPPGNRPGFGGSKSASNGAGGSGRSGPAGARN